MFFTLRNANLLYPAHAAAFFSMHEEVTFPLHSLNYPGSSCLFHYYDYTTICACVQAPNVCVCLILYVCDHDLFSINHTTAYLYAGVPEIYKIL